MIDYQDPISKKIYKDAEIRHSGHKNEIVGNENKVSAITKERLEKEFFEKTNNLARYYVTEEDRYGSVSAKEFINPIFIDFLVEKINNNKFK
jgi:hypothetical protein